MRVLILGPNEGLLSPIVGTNVVSVASERCSTSMIHEISPDMTVSFGYRHIVPPDAIAAAGGRMINLHISYLPWNRGADPNLWSWLTHTPKGVSVHWMAPEVDEGPLLAQRLVHLRTDHTLRSSYDELQRQVVDLLGSLWERVASDVAPCIEQGPGGTVHRARDKEAHRVALHSGWDTPCADVEAYGRALGLWVGPANSAE